MARQSAAAPVAPEQATPVVDTFTFKSKYREDKVVLWKEYEKRPDGSTRVISHWAEFDRNTWTTRDPDEAQKMRDRIADGLRDRRPLHIVETTNLK